MVAANFVIAESESVVPAWLFCLRPADPANGRVRAPESESQWFPGSSVYFDCDADGHYLSGSRSLTCQSNGKFDGNPPTCGKA